MGQTRKGRQGRDRMEEAVGMIRKGQALVHSCTGCGVSACISTRDGAVTPGHMGARAIAGGRKPHLGAPRPPVTWVPGHLLGGNTVFRCPKTPGHMDARGFCWGVENLTWGPKDMGCCMQPQPLHNCSAGRQMQHCGARSSELTQGHG